MLTSKSTSLARRAMLGTSVIALTSFWLATSSQPASADPAADGQKTASPIKHVIVLIGENRTFDHVFATYVSPSGDSVSNLLSKGIINSDGTPGKNFKAAAQFQAVLPFQTQYFISLSKNQKAPYRRCQCRP